MERADQERPAPPIVEQVVFKIRVALDDPHVAEHFVEHAGGAPSAPLLAEFAGQLPSHGAEEPR